MQIVNLKTTIAALALGVALTIPAAGSAHPSMYLIVGKIANKAETQTLTVDATGGTYKPSENAKTIPWNAPSWRVQDALGADPAIGPNAVNGQANVLVTGSPGGPYSIRFQGSLATTDFAPLVPNSAGLSGGTATASIATVINGTATNTTYAGDPTGATLQDTPQQAVIVNDGNVTMWTEANGLTDHGWLNLKFAPGGFRASMTGLQWLNYVNIQSGIQTHATCQNVPVLNTDANAQAVQEFFGSNMQGDPFWNYVPWQKTSVPGGIGGDADPAKWINVVKTATNGLMGAPAGGVDLNTLNTVAEFRSACEAMAGVYVPADTQGGTQASAQIAAAVTAATTPLNAQITTLTDQVNALTAEKAQLETDLEQAENERDALLNRPLDVVLSSSKSKGKVVVMVTGPFSASTSLKLQISEADRKKLKLPSRTIATATRGFGSKGAAIATLTPGSKAAKAIAKRAVATKITVLATSGVLTDSAKGSIS
jgi:hypothetical protein